MVFFLAAAGSAGAASPPFVLVLDEDVELVDELELLVVESPGSGLTVVELDPSPSASPPQADRPLIAKQVAATKAAGRRTSRTLLSSLERPSRRLSGIQRIEIGPVRILSFHRQPVQTRHDVGTRWRLLSVPDWMEE
ncbi:hypothetical protein [Janibacter limosus]|uniref:Uncharacterized protein n=1 Tax=Janibacter limosus TaxID=53458 RepID=A0A4P6MRZ7_9MICO|nr:hypothetical protein [Janibacter limosus]QBF45596.1 hypothetical protein EXU32_04545 [Janibacter limosus]